MTIAMMKTFGVNVVRKTDPGSDASSATYLLAVAAITCSYEFSNNTKSGPDPKAVVQEVSRFFKHVTGQSPN